MTSALSPEFYRRDVLDVARGLLGMRLVRVLDGCRISGLICETEAYRGEEDQACHARAGRTPRTAVMYGPPGRAYVYFTYGMHWLLNCVTGEEGYPAAVLVRAMLPQEGLDQIAARRPRVKPALWCDGPAKLTRAMGIDGALNNADLCSIGGDLWIEPGMPAAEQEIATGPRVGIDSAPEPWKSIPWRFIWQPSRGQ